MDGPQPHDGAAPVEPGDLAHLPDVLPAGAEPNKDYFGEAAAALNAAATRVWWGSNWNATGAGARRYEAFVVEFPSDWEAQAFSAR